MNVKVIKIGENLLAENDKIAGANAELLRHNGIASFNVMGTPGAGKTALLESLIPELNRKFPCAVIEGDIAGTFDSERLKKLGIPIVQINTAGACHLEAFMLQKGLEHLSLGGLKILFVENVGNLVCPAEFTLGIMKNIIVSSVTEGDDKPAKYPLMYKISHLCVLNKTDLLDLSTFSPEKFNAYAKEINPALEIIPVSAKTGENIDKIVTWITNAVRVV